MIRFPKSASTSSHYHQHDGGTGMIWRKPRKQSEESQVSAASTGTETLSPLRARTASEGCTSSSAAAGGGGLMRSRLNSRDIPRTYSGLYGNKDDSLLPFELNRHPHRFSIWVLLGLYMILLAIAQTASMILVHTPAGAGDLTWTWTHAAHALITLVYLHWLKGSLYDDAGELDALTVWEQLEATQGTRPLRECLMVVPCLLAWIACHAAGYEKHVCFANIVLWMVSMLGKLPFMNGVRLFGINRTAGIDDTLFENNHSNHPTTTATSAAASSSNCQDDAAGPKRR